MNICCIRIGVNRNYPYLQILALFGWIFMYGTVHAQSSGMCMAHPEPELGAGTPADLPLATVSDMSYLGGFAFSKATYGGSTMNYSDAIIEQSGNSMFVVGHAHHDQIAEFLIPELVISDSIADLETTSDPIQVFSTILNRTPGGNEENMNWITGMEVIDDKLVVNAHEWYDASAGNTDTTLIISDASNIVGSEVSGYFDFPGAARAGGWISPIPSEWQSALDGEYITGFSNATSIIGRHSVGPSAHSFRPIDLFNASDSNPVIPTSKLMEFSVDNPLHEDLLNENLSNDLWTIETEAWFGFIVPGTSTYATFGALSGSKSGIGYKITQSNGNKCGGYCPPDADDDYAYYWFFDVKDLLKVKQGELAPSAVRPYEYGVFPAPYQPEVGAHPISGGSFDESNGVLYLTLASGANNNQGPYSRTPLVIAYEFPY